MAISISPHVAKSFFRQMCTADQIGNSSMDKNNIIEAVSDAIFLLNDELESVVHDELAERYKIAIENLQKVLITLRD